MLTWALTPYKEARRLKAEGLKVGLDFSGPLVLD